MSTFSNCQINGFCKVPHEQAISIIAAGLDNKGIDNRLKSEIYKLLTQYFVGVVSDFKKGEEFMQHAITLHEDVNGRLIFTQVYRLQNKLTQAQQQLQQAKQLDTQNVWIKEIEIEQRIIDNAMLTKKRANHES